MLSVSKGVLSSFPRAGRVAARQQQQPICRTKPTSQNLFSRFYKMEASDLKVGDVIEHKNKLLEVTKIQHVFGAQRSASMQAEFKDLRTGNKGAERFRVAEPVEVVELEWKEVTFEGEKDGEFEFSDEDGEMITFPKKIFEGKEPWLRPGVDVQVRMNEDKPLYFRFANRTQILQIKSTREVEQITPRGKPAELTNGIVVKVPIFLQNGAWVKVDVVTEEYLSKEDGPPKEEDDDEE